LNSPVSAHEWSHFGLLSLARKFPFLAGMSWERGWAPTRERTGPEWDVKRLAASAAVAATYVNSP